MESDRARICATETRRTQARRLAPTALSSSKATKRRSTQRGRRAQLEWAKATPWNASGTTLYNRAKAMEASGWVLEVHTRLIRVL